ncbi:MAG: methylmalonyl-CoA mutase family protein, partial [Rhodospirillales bacterium]|nr:methylmalonyl-CoA mutase family protein [Rhodospirillales bacterium]
IDPLGGSYYVESLTASLAAEARKLISEVEGLGGMTRAVESGFPKRRIEESAARRQARIDRGEETVVGVNKYPADAEEELDLLEVDNSAVRASQISRLEKIRTTRDEAACRASLNALTRVAETGEGNLLELSIVAVRARATVGEISDALEKIYGRYQATTKMVSGVYASAFKGDADFAEIRESVKVFAAEEGRRPRLLVVKMGQDGHDRGAKVIATAFADLGFDVDVGALFQTPAEAAQEALENDVHIIGVSTQAGGHKTLVPALIEELKKKGADDVIVICGGVVPPKDYDGLKKAGVAAIYGPGTHIPSAAKEILDLLARQRCAD